MLHYVSSETAVTARSMSDFDHEIVLEPGHNRIGLAHALIPKTYYLVQQGSNTFLLDGTEYTVPPGNYSIESFRALVNSLIAPGSIQMDHRTGKWTISSSAASLTFPVGRSESLHRLFGFALHSTNVFSGGSLVSVKCALFQRAPVTHVLCNGVYDKSSGAFDDLLGTVSMLGSDFSYVPWTNPEIAMTSKPLRLPNTSSSDHTVIYKFCVTDEEGSLLDTNGIPVSLNVVTFKPNEEARDLLSLARAYVRLRTDHLNYQLMVDQSQSGK